MKKAKTTKSAAGRKVKAAKKPAVKAAKKSKPVAKRLTAQAAIKDGKAFKVYRLRNGIPKELKRESAGRAILESISRHRAATSDTIRADMKSGYPDATLRFYLGKFQRERVIIAKSVA